MQQWHKILAITFLFVSRLAVFVLCCASLSRMTAAPDAMNYTAFRFHDVALTMQLPYCVTRLVYDIAIVVWHVPLPSHCGSVAIIIFDSVISLLIFAASSSMLSVEVYMDKDTGACALMQPGACKKYKEAVLLSLLASLLSWAIALLLFILQSFRYALAHAPAPAPAAPAYVHDQDDHA